MKLVEHLRRLFGYEMTSVEREEQRRSFAYGNLKIGHPNVTREFVDEVADRMATPEE